jgi:hypothetical protein
MLNPNYNKTITLFNCLKGADNPDGTVDVWYKTVIPESFFKSLMSAVYTGTSSQMVGTYTARIQESIRYKAYAEWCKEPAVTRGNYFTGNVGDIIVLGASLETIGLASPNTYAHVLTRNKPNAFKVTAFGDNSGTMQPHYRFGG